MTDVVERLAAHLAGRYELVQEVGQGGMATVYQAHDRKHERKVAVKLLRPELGALLGADRFLDEIRITAHLHHPHILPLFDSGAADGLLWYVMPFVEGESLRDRLAREGPLPVDTAIAFAAQVTSALDYAHRHRIIHRDIKPANILLVEDQALVADFGIALGVREAAGTRLTLTGLSLGTPQYMSPEQAAGSHEVDARTDVYSVGCVLFEMLTGRPPFTGLTTQSVIAQVLTEDPPLLSTLRSDAPAVLDGVLERALARNPEHRYQTAGELGAALRALLGGTGAFPSAAVARRAKRRTLIAGALAVGLVAGWVVLRPRPPVIPEVGGTSRLTYEPGAELDPAISPDGRMVAYAGGPVGRMRIWVRQLGEGKAVPLTADLGGNHRWPRWAPDGSRLAFYTSGEAHAGIYLIPALGGSARRLVEFSPDSETFGFAWSRDGSTVAYGVDSVVYVQSLDGATPATSVPRVIGRVAAPHSFSFSPDGAFLALTVGNPNFVFGTAALGNAAPTSIQILPVASGEPVTITDNSALNVSPVWAPDGRGLYFVSDRGGARDIWFQPLARGRPRGEPVRLTTGLQAHTIDVAADGSRLLYSTLALQANIWRVPIPMTGPAVTPATATQLTTGTQAIEGIGVSKDGRWLAFDSDLSGNQEIYKIPTAGGTSERLTNHPADDFIPAWSPDGHRIAFYSFRGGNRDLFVMSADGGSVEQVTSDPSHERVPDWSPDGRSLVFYSDRTGRAELFVVSRTEDADGSSWSPARQLTRAGGANPRWSPDGREIAYRGGFSVQVIPAQGGEPRTVVRPGDPATQEVPHWMQWAPDGRMIYFKTLGPDGRSTIFSVPAAGGTPRAVLVFPDPARQSPRTEFDTDGRFLYFTLGSHEADIWTLELRPET